ncbi:rRNA pseudouridine synthase [uncultured Pseudoxanthomonas sp.]|uniref:rRNA pseudouridine synthase n=1 Tax=uncultured Pseudoxanthomonas sp. TaxID=281701 RepID=UPI0026043E73|nr:rRNA pseudouridine synthase [uncultured Pseudoxanthomonas sp.]
MSEPIRLAKRVAELTGCSRTEAEQYIEGGWVTVDGETIETPQHPVTTERVEIDPAAERGAVEPATLLLHKPQGVAWQDAPALATPEAHMDGDDSGVRPLKRHFHRLTPLVPLDDEASGLVVLSQDGRVWRRLSEDYAQIEQEFVVEVRGATDPYTLSRIGLVAAYRGQGLAPCKVSWQNEVRLRFAIKNVQPGELRHRCREGGLDVVSIRRLRIGRVALSKMPAGQWRYLPAGTRF